MTKLSPETRASLRTRTRLIHAGRHPDEQHGFINTPIYRGSTVLYESMERLERPSQKFTYGTKGTPTTAALEEAWSEISRAAGTVLVPSGLAAITVALFAAVRSGGHLLVTDSVYSPSRHFCDTVLKRMGVETTYFDPLLGAGIADLMRPETCAVLVESPGSLTFEVQDVPAIAAAAHARGVCVLLDNTWATPLLFSPHEHGVDIAIEAGTKYLSGHSDLLLGMVSANTAWWPRLRSTFDAFAMCAGPEDVFLGLRGMRTMLLRLREAEAQALTMARWLEARPEVARVLHPALPSCPGHDIWARDFDGSSGVFSVVLKPAPKPAVAALLDGLELFGLGYSWGGYESLVVPFDPRRVRSASASAFEGPCLRFSIGLEDCEDLQADLDRGFSRLNAARG